MENDYELEDDYAPRILWGRLAFFLLALILAFFGGRACAPSGVPQAKFEAIEDQAFELASENAQLNQRLDAQEDTPPDTGGGAGRKRNNNGGGEGDGAGAEATEDPTEEGQDSIGKGEEYEVQSGDTLYGLAEKFYGDTNDYTLIAEANNLDLETDLVVGQILVIPPDTD